MKSACLMTAVLMFTSAVAQATVSLSGTRLVFDGRFGEASVDVSNRSDAQVLIQAWLADGRAAESHRADLPFVVTPHLAQLPAQGKQTLRVLYEGVGMPADRESLLHLFVLEIPRRSQAAQQLSIAVRQRINVFYRPAGLPGDPADAAQMLAWQRQPGGELSARNPTPYHVSLQNVRVDGVEISDYQLLPPFSEISLPLPVRIAGAGMQRNLSFKALTDYGGQRDYCGVLPAQGALNVPLSRPDSHSLKGKC